MRPFESSVDAVATIGIDLGATRVKAGWVAGGRVQRSLIANLAPADRSPSGIVERLADTVLELAKAADTPLERLAGIGIGAPGVIRFGTGTVVQSPNFPEWRDFPLAERLRQRLGVHVVLDNDANVVTLGEARYGVGAGVGDLALLTLGSGVGGGLFLCGDLYRGSDGMAGEIGHMVVDPDGPACGCGGRGCLEQYASLNALRAWVLRDRAYGDLTGEAVRDPRLPERLYEAAVGGDRRSQGYFDEMGRALAVTIGGLLNLLNLRMVILAGGIARAFPAFSRSLFEELEARTFPAVLAGARVVPCELWETAGILGAASLAAAVRPT